MEKVKIVFIAPWYNYNPILPMSLLLQTDPSWKLYLIHDGPIKEGFFGTFDWKPDPRIIMEVSEKTVGPGNQWGHVLRVNAIERIAQEDWKCDWVVHTNGDNYYVPGFCEIMTREGKGADMVYCDMVHNHHQWITMNSELREARIDCGAMMIRSDWAKEIGWPYRNYAADWSLIEKICLMYPNSRKFHVQKSLFVHN